MNPLDETNVAYEEQRLQQLENERAGLSVAMMLPQNNTKENLMKFVEVNAEIHKTGQKLRRMGSGEYVLPESP
eukprot:CAMPEP_0183784718 /NCGR_PEP_ID=MMETSP0739-20130205/66130_1 /TAXON_ID=385413 /ORGANISM="Thalassiosira miniscula, Strain CCMP1093" /LENGTH=72 /DNA_ID=CAMNT_0026028695 /DNA_START=82 /DNA_END=300 /DNA_ORIENTATION=+